MIAQNYRSEDVESPLPTWNIEDSYPLCKQYHYDRGTWHEKNTLLSTPEGSRELYRHYALLGPGKALHWDYVWLPDNCSYHRFTSRTVNHFLDKLRHSSKGSNFPREDVEIVVIGDSGIRGILCGLGRLLNGSEIYGPNDNLICGGSTGTPISMDNVSDFYSVQLTPHFKMTFRYIFGLNKNVNNSFDEFFMPNLLYEYVRDHRPYAFFLCTGIWDFEYLWKYHNYTHNWLEDSCITPEAKEVAELRASPAILDFFRNMSSLARTTDTRLIYRTNHLNYRYPAQCADSILLERLLKQQEGPEYQRVDPAVFPHLLRPWEIWDNYAITNSSLVREFYIDFSFHYDRIPIHTVADHENLYISHPTLKHCGTLETQLTQLFLNTLFYPEILKAFERKEEFVSSFIFTES